MKKILMKKEIYTKNKIKNKSLKISKSKRI